MLFARWLPICCWDSFIAGVLHVFVPQKFYAKYLSRNNKGSATEEAIRAAVEGIGYTFKGRK